VSDPDPAFVRVSELRLEAVGKRYGSAWAARDVAISVHPGELYTLLGPSGCGKTTLLRLVAGFVAPDAGRVVIDDEVVDAVPAWRRNIGMVFPDGALWPHLSAFDNVALGLRVRGRPATEVERRVESALRGSASRRSVHRSPRRFLPSINGVSRSPVLLADEPPSTSP